MIDPLRNARADELRRAFDRAFAIPRAVPDAAGVRFLRVLVGGVLHLVSLDEITAIVAVRKIVPLPGAAGALLGLAGHAGRLVPVFDLAALIGHEGATTTPRWLLLVGAPDVVALAIAEVDGQLDAPRTAVHAAAAEGGRRPTEVLHTAERTLPIISVVSILDTLTTSLER